ncbi:MAG: hypothetical protein NTX57_02105 [Armatimonadetes bacterium]|nr:hypothetical protein [Armatimonadota bacterium]
MSVLEADAPLLAQESSPVHAPLKVATASAVLRDLFIVTWSAPMEKLQALVPPGTTLERLPRSDGQLVGFVQVIFALRENARWSPLPSQLGEDYQEATLQVLTRTENERSAAVIKHFVSSTTIATSLLPFSRVAEESRFSVYVAGDPARQTFERLGVKVTTHAVQLHLRAECAETPEATMIGSWHESVRFLTRLERQLHPARLSKDGQSLFRTQHPPLSPRAATLTHQVVRPFDDLELGEPLLALYQAELPVTNLPIKQK